MGFIAFWQIILKRSGVSIHPLLTVKPPLSFGSSAEKQPSFALQLLPDSPQSLQRQFICIKGDVGVSVELPCSEGIFVTLVCPVN